MYKNATLATNKTIEKVIVPYNYQIWKKSMLHGSVIGTCINI